MTPRATVLEFFRVYSHGDSESALALCVDNVCHTANAFHPEAKFAGSFLDVAAVRRRVEHLAAHWAFERFSPDMIIAEGNEVAARVHVVATERHTGARVDMRTALFFTIEDGRIVALDEIFDASLTEAASGHRAQES